MKFLILIFLSIFFCSTLSFAESTLLKVVGVSAGHVVTNRDIEIDTIVESVLFNTTSDVINATPAYRNQVLLEWAAYTEAHTFALSRVPTSEVNSQMRTFLAKVKSNENLHTRWTNLQPSSFEMRSLMKRKLRAKKFMQFKEQSSLVPTTDEEALNYYQRHKNQYEDADFSEVSDQIKTMLSQQRAKNRIEQWHQTMKSKHKIRYGL